MNSEYVLWFCFFFQAEDGIRDADVTGVQTCALPISGRPNRPSAPRRTPADLTARTDPAADPAARTDLAARLDPANPVDPAVPADRLVLTRRARRRLAKGWCRHHDEPHRRRRIHDLRHPVLGRHRGWLHRGTVAACGEPAAPGRVGARRA